MSFSDHLLFFVSLSVCELFTFQGSLRLNIVQMKGQTFVRGEIKTNTV